MKIYISSHCPFSARHVAAVLAQSAITVVSTWHSSPPGYSSTLTDQEKQEKCLDNSVKIKDCDVLFCIADTDKVPGGKFVEVGMALAWNKKVIIIGRRENLLMNHPSIFGAVDSSDLPNTLEQIDFLL